MHVQRAPTPSVSRQTVSEQRFRMACPLSQIRLYAHMAAFYEEQGVSAWVDNIIPHFIVGNARFAKQYANVRGRIAPGERQGN